VNPILNLYIFDLSKPEEQMMDKGMFFFTVGELRDLLQQFPEDMPVVVSGYKSGYENFYHPYVVKIACFPENPEHEGQFQRDDNGTDVLLLEREMRFD